MQNALFPFTGYSNCEIPYRNMNVLTSVLLTGGAIIAFNAMQKAQASGTLNFYPASVKNIRFDGITPVVTLGLAIQNPSNQRFTIKSFAGNLYANDILIGNVSSYVNTIVAPNSQTVYDLNIRLSILGIVNDIIEAFQGNGLRQELELQAWINVDSFVVPVNIKYSIP